MNDGEENTIERTERKKNEYLKEKKMKIYCVKFVRKKKFHLT